MRVFRFGEDLSVPVTDFESLMRICPLASADHGPVRAAVIHVPAGGRIGRHPAASPQLFAVVSGSGWVVGGDELSRRGVEAGVAVMFDAGEEHEAGSDTGFMAVVLEGDVAPEAVVVTQPIVVVEYDPAWPEWFVALRDHLWPAVSDVALRIEHVGSTSVPGLAAKPVIDLDIVLAGAQDVPRVVERLRDLGYRWQGDLGVEGREAFQLPPSLRGRWPRHHLYAVVEGNRAHLDHVLLRDLLRSDPEAREAYAQLKRANVELANGDMDVYVAAKAELVAELLARARSERGLPAVEYWQP